MIGIADICVLHHIVRTENNDVREAIYLKYNEEMLECMAEQIDLLSYAENTMEFVRRNKDYFTNCPFHVDNTPSLSITPDKNVWYCHSCHKGGGIYKWLQEFENLTFQQAVEKVADMTETETYDYVESETVGVYRQINKCYKRSVSDLSERKVLDFKSDYLDKYSNNLPEEWIAEGIKPEVMRQYNIMIDNNSKRIVYPVFDQNDVFISVKGRTMIPNFKELKLPKYINFYPIVEVDYFQGWSQAVEEIKKTKSVIIFEGIKSCMKSCGWGIKNTVSAETSVLSKGQIRLLIKAGMSEVIIGWDNDQQFKKIIASEEIQTLKKFTKVSIIRDVKGLLSGDKMAPVDAGEEIYRKLLRERIVI